ncbi:MAG: phosphatase PAP2 family protein [Nocardioidaceae bacterium]
MTLIRNLDDRLFFAINDLARNTGWLHPVLVDFAKYGVVLFGLLLLAGLFYARSRDSRTLAAAGWSGVATLIALGVNQPVVNSVHEARPYETHPGILLLVSRSVDYSFPSDHGVMAGAVAAGLFLVWRRLGALALAAALLMAFARVYVAAHYPWDVLAGLLLGAGVTGAGWLALRAPLTALTAWLRRWRGLAGVFAPSEHLTAPSVAVETRPCYAGTNNASSSRSK